MSILSITFHTTENALNKWDGYVESTLKLMIQNLMDVEKYILSEVHTDMISEGKNTNLLLIFSDNACKDDFLKSELLNIEEHLTKEFGQDVMIFVTHLHPKSSNF